MANIINYKLNVTSSKSKILQLTGQILKVCWFTEEFLFIWIPMKMKTQMSRHQKILELSSQILLKRDELELVDFLLELL